MPPRRSLHAEYFLLAHDGYSGRPHIDAALLGAGVAGALLGELTLAGHLALDGGVPRVTGLPADAVAASTVDILRRGRHGVERWIELLAGAAYAMVGDDLVRSGVVHRPPAGRLARLGRARARYVATDALAGAAPRVLLRHAADAGTTDERIGTLAALALATGLEGVVADGANRAALGRLRAMAAEVSGDAGTVVEAVRAAAAAIALTPRRGQ
ncbi:GPP34 family phosphoprotein [Dactylosporangium sp. NPDC048998]|uniref:GPP34 family phosphoprotein n=1 Tax=Dactylosporangium sp. NPDC048998 TaxID=3363976 RepID=UPI003712B8AF